MPRSKSAAAKNKLRDDKFMCLTEMANEDILRYLIDNEEQFTGGEGGEWGRPARDFAAKFRGGMVRILYRQHEGFGRFHPVGGNGLAAMSKKLRHTISRGVNRDYDIVNAHPVILSHLCHEYGFSCPTLDKYIENREEHLKSTGMSRRNAKKLFLTLTNGGGVESFSASNISSSAFVSKYADEMSRIHELFAAKFPDEYARRTNKRIKNGNTNNHEASFMNTRLCDFENKILQEMYIFIGRPEMCTLCYDGFMVPADMDINLRECANHVKRALGIDIDIIEKNMTDGYDISKVSIPKTSILYPGELSMFKKATDMAYNMIISNDVGDVQMAKMFHSVIGRDLKVVDSDGDGFLWDYDTCLWTFQPKNFMAHQISNPRRIFVSAVTAANIKAKMMLKTGQIKIQEDCTIAGVKSSISYIKKYMGSVMCANNMYRRASMDLYDPEFRSLVNIKHHLLPIKSNKVIDLSTGYVRNRTREDMFSITCPVNYISETEWTEQDRADLYSFINPIFVDDPEYIAYQRVNLGSMLCGIIDRKFNINHGHGMNAKSALSDLMLLILGQFATVISKEVVISSGGSRGTSGGHTSHLVGIEGRRLVVTQELKNGDILNCDMIKKICSGDKMAIREVYKSEVVITPFCKIIISTNYIPEFDVEDRAIIDRCVINPFKARFMTDDELAKEKTSGRYNDSQFTYYPSNPSLVKKYKAPGRTVDIFFSWLVGGCMEYLNNKTRKICTPLIVDEYKDTQVCENDIVGQFLNAHAERMSRDQFEKLKPRQKARWTTNGKLLYDTFADWAVSMGCARGQTKKRFTAYLMARFTRVRKRDGMCYEGLKLGG